MDPRERFADPEEALRTAMQGMRAGLWTALPGYFVSFNTDDPGNVTAVIQPAIQGVIQQPNGTYQAVNLPLLLDVPVVFPSGGGCTLTFPLQAGDECLVVFSSRCIDGWWQNGKIPQLPMEPRLHDLSDGFAIPGPRSKARPLPNISTSAVQLRSDDGATVISLDPNAQTVIVTAPGGVNVSGGASVDSLSTSGDLSAGNGATGMFRSQDGHTVKVTNGIITSIL